MMFIRSILLIAFVPFGSAQFKCSLSGSKDSNDCTTITDDGTHCVWCTVDAVSRTTTTPSIVDYGVCVSEVQAEAMEKTKLPKFRCDRYSGTDDGVTPDTNDDVEPATDDTNPKPSTDDVAPTTDDTNPEPSTDDVTPTTDDTNPEPPTDDAAPNTDDTNPEPSTDDETPPDNNDDHSVPDDFWTCLQKKTSSTCTHANCTWCDTKGGFGLCMTGPTADSASHSAWFKCQKNDTTEELQPQVFVTTQEAAMDVATPIQAIDMTCVANFYEHPTANECMTTMDNSGLPCQWCTILDMATMCLSSDQVEMGEGLGLSCENQNDEPIAVAQTFLQDPYDPSCVLAFIEDSSESTCTATVDSDGITCEYCTLQGQFNVCLTSEQAAMGEQYGVTCGSDDTTIKTKDDPYDTTCLLAYLQDSTKDGCVAAVDEDGAPCEFCSLQSVFDVCLTSEQAEMGEQLGITCDDSSSSKSVVTEIVKDDPYDPSCLLAYLQDQSKETCVAAVDEDNNPCEFCNLQGALALCLTAEQAEMGSQLGITSDEMTIEEKRPLDTYDTSCLVAFWSDQSEQSCSVAIDGAGNNCEYCSLPGSFSICLNSDEAKIGESVGMVCNSETGSSNVKANDPLDTTCALSYLQTPTKDACTSTMDADGSACELCNLKNSDYFMCLSQDQAKIGEQIGFACETSTDPVAFPVDVFECLEKYQEDDCRNSPCTWCNTQAGISFCLAPAAAESTKQSTFFDCELNETPEDDIVDDIYDPVCLAAGMPIDSNSDASVACAEAKGTDGNPCIWCDAEGVFGLCLSSEQAAAAGHYLQCDAGAVSVSF